MAVFSLQEIEEATGAKALEMAKDCFSGVVTDTRKLTEGALFVAIKGENFNGEDFVSQALENGANGVLVGESYDYDGPLGGTVFQVSGDSLAAYSKIARYHRKRFDIPMVTITGSNGKTTTKDLTAAVLSAKYNVLKTHANFNNEVGLPMTLLQLNESHEAAVTEIGMRGLGQIAELAPVACPNIGIVTNVGETHMEILGSMENIAKAKAELVEAIAPGGTAILNADNPYTAAMDAKCQPGVKVVTFGIENDADVRASNIRTVARNTVFDCSFSSGAKASFELSMLGRHNVYNALAAIAAGFVLGMDADDIQRGLANLEMSKMRFEYRKIGEYTVINDAYNASPMSMKAALETISEVAVGRVVAVLGDMLELGDIEIEAHRQVGKQAAASGISILIAYGKLGEEIAKGAREAGMEAVYEASSHKQAADLLHGLLSAGDTILLKASRGMKLEKILELL